MKVKNGKNEHKNLENNTTQLIMTLNKNNNKANPQNKESQFVITDSKNLLTKRLHETVEKAKTSIDIIGKCKSFPPYLFDINFAQDSIEKGCKSSDNHSRSWSGQNITA